MLIAGLQKLTLLDFPGKTACTVFTPGCNFRCPFCHNALLVTDIDGGTFLDEEEFFSFLNKRKGILEGVAITGGEPTLQRDLPLFIKRIKDMGFLVKLDSNGTNPEMLEALLKEGLVDRVAMDIKNDPSLYGETAGLKNFDISGVQRSRDLLLEGHCDYEFRTTVVKGLHTKESLRGAARWIEGAKEYYLQQYKDSGNVIDPRGLGAFGEAEMKELLEAVREIIPGAKLRGL